MDKKHDSQKISSIVSQKKVRHTDFNFDLVILNWSELSVCFFLWTIVHLFFSDMHCMFNIRLVFIIFNEK